MEKSTSDNEPSKDNFKIYIIDRFVCFGFILVAPLVDWLVCVCVLSRLELTGGVFGWKCSFVKMKVCREQHDNRDPQLNSKRIDGLIFGAFNRYWKLELWDSEARIWTWRPGEISFVFSRYSHRWYCMVEDGVKSVSRACLCVCV